MATKSLYAQVPSCNTPNITMSCSNMVNISMDQTCVKTIQAQEILATPFSCYNTFSVEILNTNLGATVTAVEVGKIFDVKVKHSVSGNSCWGKVRIEDKLAPKFTCPSDATISCETANMKPSLIEKVAFDNIPDNNIADTSVTGIYGLPVVAENCTGYTLSYFDIIDDKDCTSAGISAVITRTWRAKDAHGNTSMCVVKYTLTRLSISAVLFPTDLTIECSANYKKDSKGNPSPLSSGAPSVNGVLAFPSIPGYCEISASYQDQRSIACGTTYKVIRKWTVIDWCANQVSQSTQIIKIADTTLPVVTAALPDVTISTSPDVCLRKVYVPGKPTATDNCAAKIKYSYCLYEEIGPWQFASGDTLRNLNIGKYRLETKVADECGNTTISTSYVTILDVVPPVAVCDLDTKVDLINDGTATVNASTFDDGSVDACGVDIERFEVKRMGAPDSDFAKTIKFSCADDKLQVIMRVWDYSNNSNTCMVNVDVDDKLPPVIFVENITLKCTREPDVKAWLDAHRPQQKSLTDFPSATNPGYYDNCGASPFVKKDDNKIDNCGNGSFVRTWEITDGTGNKVTVNQTVTLVNRSAYKVTFPTDKTANCSAAHGLYDLSTKGNGEPIIEDLANTCALVSVSHFDEKFTSVSDGCFKILRHWKILNWCEADVNYNADHGDEYMSKDTAGNCNPAAARCFVNIGKSTLADPNYHNFTKDHNCYDFDSDGYMEYVQVIKVVDNDAPVIGNIEIDIEDSFSKNCTDGAMVNIKKVEVRDCSDSTTVVFTSNIPNYSAGKVPLKLTNVPYGKYKINFKASDNCGNFASKILDIEVKEQKKPTPVCINDLAVELMQTGEVWLNAKLFNKGSYDNCTDASKLKFRLQVPAPGAGASFDVTKTDTMYNFTCSNIKAGDKSAYISVALWVGDEAGNWDYCETSLFLQDNMNACINFTPNQMKKIAGAIKSPNAEPVENVSIKLEGTNGTTTASNIKGEFAFANLYPTQKYDLTPEKNIEPLNGVSTLDLVLMSKHILGTQTFTTMYQSLAADVNNSGTISTADMVELRKMILGLQSNFSKNTSWRFVELGQNYDPIQTAWIKNLTGKKTFSNLQTATSADFVAVKIGDVSGNAKVSSATGNAGGRGEVESVYFNVNTNSAKSGEIVTLNFQNEDFKNIEGYQFTLIYDKNKLELVKINGNEENFALLEKGVLTTSWNGAASTEQLFSLTFRAKQNVDLAEAISAGSSVLSNEIYTTSGENKRVTFKFGNNISTPIFELYQNQPNPFGQQTTITFQLPTTQQATLILTDITGRIIKQFSGEYKKGINQISISKTDIGVSGVIYYQLSTATNTAAKKMLIIE